VLSVNSEAAANVSFQGAAQRSARSDQPPGNDIFGVLVDSNTAADANNANSTAQQPPAPNHSDNTPPPADNSGPANNASANQPANNDANNGGNNSGPPSNANGNNANANSAASTGSSQQSGANSSAPKAGATKSTATSTTDHTSTVDPTLAQQAGLSLTAPTPVAVVIPVTIVATNTPAATPTSGSATAPLAIAAAAIAASSQAISAQAASSAQIKTDPNAATASTATTTTTAATATATAKIAVTASAGQTVATATNPSATSAALTTTVAATAPVAAKTTSKTTASGTASGTADPSTADSSTQAAQNSLVQQPSGAGKPDAANVAVDAAAEAAAGAVSSTSAGAISAHEHASVAGAAHTPTDAPDAGIQTAGTIQPQLNTPATTSAATLTATAATNAPVPLSGLAVEIAASVKSGKSSFEIRLDPADLGRIDVRIDIDHNGQVTSHLTVEKPETLSMLRQDAPQLQRALDDAGLKTGDNGLQFSLRDQSSSGQNSGGDTGRNAQRLVISDDDTTPAAIAGRSYGRSLGSSSGVDIRV